MSETTKTAIITFRDGLKGSMWSYEVLINSESMMSISSDWDYAPEDCTRYLD